MYNMHIYELAVAISAIGVFYGRGANASMSLITSELAMAVVSYLLMPGNHCGRLSGLRGQLQMR
jgi:hypothetical protein